MTQPTLDLDALQAAAEAAGGGAWEYDTVKNEGEYGPGEDAVSGFNSYCIIDFNGNTLLDTLNFDQSEIHEEYDEDSFYAWDEPARKVAEFVAAANPAVVLALIDRLRKAEAARETEYGWLVENGKSGDELRYRTWRDGMPEWTADHSEATRYCRRIDAERAHQEDEDARRIAEHAWDAEPDSEGAKG